MTKTEKQQIIARTAEIVLRPRYEWKLLIMRLKVKLRKYKRKIETERSYVAPFGWEYRFGIGGQVYLWPVNHVAKK
jgi:hypothetical protein